MTSIISAPLIKRYNIPITNNTGSNVQASYYEQLAGPLLDDASKYMCAIERCRVSTTNIPLSRKNLPFEGWSVGIGYKKTSDWIYETAYVDQINQQYSTLLKTFCVSSSSGTSQMNNALTTTISTNALPASTSMSTTLAPTYDFATGTQGTIYYISTDLQSVYCVDIASNTLLQTITQPNSLVNYSINSIYADQTSGTLYIGVWNSSGVSPNFWQVCIYTRSANVWTYSTSLVSSSVNTYMYSITVLNNLLFASSVPSILGSDNINIVVFDLGSNTQVNYYTLSNVFTAQMRTYNNYIYLADSYSSNIRTYTTDSNGNLTQVSLQIALLKLNSFVAFTGFDVSGNIIYWNINGTYQNINNVNLSLAANTLLVINGDPYQQAIDSQDQIITTYQQYLNQINNAFSTVFNNISGQSGFGASDAPIIAYTQTTNTFMIVLDTTYDDSTKYRIIMNENLWNMFLFPTISASGLPTDSSGSYQNILIQNHGSNVSGSLLSVYQETSTAFKFFDMVRVIVKTLMPILGDQEGFNNSDNVLTDILPDTTTLSPSEPIIYIPTELRWYNLTNSGNWRTMSIEFWYGTRDGSTYKIYLSPNDYASCKLAFKKVID